MLKNITGARPRIPPQFDVRLRVKRRIDKRGRQLRGFETLPEAKRELRHRVRLLASEDHDDGMPVAFSLFCCEEHGPCESLACPRCARTRRIDRSAAILEFLASYPLEDLRFLTLIKPDDAVVVGELHTFNPRRLINRLRRQLERAGISKDRCFVIGGVDGEWEEGWHVFQPHLHGITWGITNEDLKRLLKHWPRDPERVRVRKRLEEFDDLPRIVTYTEKSWWPSVARTNNPFEI